MNPITRTTVILLFTAWCIDYIDRSVIGVALPSIGKDLDLGHGQLGLVVSVFFIAYALAQVPGGMLADRFGAMRVAIAGLVAWSVFTGLTAVAASLAMLLVIRLLFGLAQGIFPAAGMKLLAERSTPEERMTANGWVNSANAVGVVLAMIIAAMLLPLVGWRGMFLAISVIGLAVTVIFARRMPAPMVGIADAPRSSIRSTALLRSRAMWWFSLAFLGYDVIVWGMGAWVPTYLQEHFGLSASASALLVLPAGLAAAAVIVLTGRASDRIDGRPIALIVPGIVIGGVAIALVPHMPNVATTIAVLTLGGGASATTYIGCFSLPLKQLAPSAAGIGASMILLGGMVAGVIAPTVFGIIVDSAGWTAAWSFLAIGAVVTLIATALMPHDAKAFRAAVPNSLLAQTNTSELVAKD
ncbi:MFS transporter [Gordonia sp. CPCC 205515]|uniref:MFS transporter n=1 Tax=Gordonia sp. CPCC 205515 TaxID=3140791 RepID=UPI003AF3EC0E